MYYPNDHSSISKITILFKEKVMFRQYIPESTNIDKHCGIKV
jgi:hypothetical protein